MSLVFVGDGTSSGQCRVLALAEFEDGGGEDDEKDFRISPAQHLKKLIFLAITVLWSQKMAGG